jgi:hypothetical protein
MFEQCRTATPPGDTIFVMSFRDTRMNTPAEMLVRLVYASRYFLFLAGFFMFFSAVGRGSAYDALLAVISFAGMIAGNEWLKTAGKLAECEHAFAAMCGEGPDTEDELDQLLARREELEIQRGEPGFDPWAVQALRREINDYVNHHPEARSRIGTRG